MSVIPLFWQGATRKHRFVELLKPRFEAWLLAWNANPGLSSGIETTDAGGSSLQAEAWYRFGAKIAGVVLKTNRDADVRLGCALLGLRQSDSQGMAAGIGQRAICDLVCALLSAKADGVRMEASSRPDPAAIESRHGVIALDCIVGKTTLRFHMDIDACRSLLPHDLPIGTPKLISRRQAVLSARTRLRAVLDLGELTVQEGINLRPGEILKSGLRLDGPVRLETEQGRPVLTGVLKAIDGNRAVQCTVLPEN